jgi:hypothetical protein
MTMQFDGKPPVKNTGAADPRGAKTPPIKPVPIISTATIAKARGGSAHIGTAGGNS